MSPSFFRTLGLTFFVLLATAGCSRADARAGTWETVYGGAASGNATLTLTGSGNAAFGTYNGVHSGTVEGAFNGGVLTGRWKESDTPKGQGSFTFTFGRDNASFKGLFRSDDGTYAGSWDGFRTKDDKKPAKSDKE